MPAPAPAGCSRVHRPYPPPPLRWFAASLRTDICPQRKEARPLSHALTSDSFNIRTPRLCLVRRWLTIDYFSIHLPPASPADSRRWAVPEQDRAQHGDGRAVLPHPAALPGGSLTVSCTASLTAPPTVSPTQLCHSLWLPHRVLHCLPHRASYRVSHCLSLTEAPSRCLAQEVVDSVVNTLNRTHARFRVRHPRFQGQVRVGVG